jgi:two-component system, LuxR family, response regulator FixJ
VAKLIVYVIDDDAAVRDSLHALLEPNGFEVRSYMSTIMFLAEAPPLEGSCLIIDVNMPELDGIELLGRLRCDGVMVPAILMTGGEISTSVVSRANRCSVALLEKPIIAQELVAQVCKALDS